MRPARPHLSRTPNPFRYCACGYPALYRVLAYVQTEQGRTSEERLVCPPCLSGLIAERRLACAVSLRPDVQPDSALVALLFPAAISESPAP